jgi:hypothetical protein
VSANRLPRTNARTLRNPVNRQRTARSGFPQCIV